MAVHYKPHIVTDGLVLCLDAGNTKSFVSGSTAWNDISNNGNDLTLYQGPIYNSDGSISFDGLNDYAGVDTTPTSLQGDPDFTVCGFFKSNGSWSAGGTWGIGGWGTRTNFNSYNHSVTNGIGIDLYGTTSYLTTEVYSDTEWKFVCWTKSAGVMSTSNVKIYVNNTLFTGSDFTVVREGTGGPLINSLGLVIGRVAYNQSNYYGKPRVSNFMIYDKVLTDVEIMQNFNALRGRFGI